MTGERIRVLIVDDDPGARLLHGRFVDDAPGFETAASVGTGRAALEHAAALDIDLILLDMRLPDISGIEVLNRLRTQGSRPLDVLVISSSRDQVTVRQALAGRVIGYLAKPFTQERLLERLADYRRERPVAARRAEREHALGQGEIDRLLAPTTGAPSPARPPHDALPAGIAAVTLRRVLGALDASAPRTAADIAAASGISRQTARRYLDHLVDAGRIDRSHSYGRRGRPEVLYRLAPGPSG